MKTKNHKIVTNFILGAVCKLYFDLEFSRTLNPLVDSNSLVETFIKVKYQIKNHG